MSGSRIARSVLAEVALQREEFARRLREARLNAGLTQEQAAQKIGVTLKSFNRWEAAKGATPHVSRMDDIAQALNVTRDYLQGPLPAPLGLGADDSTFQRLDEVERISRENNIMLRAVLAHLGISVETLTEPPADLIAALSDTQAKRRKSRSRV